MRAVVFSVGSTKHTIDLAEFEILDVASARQKAAAKMAWWGSVWGEAQAEVDRADAGYRAWYAGSQMATLKEDPKAAEWKVKAVIESSPQFLEFKRHIADMKEAAKKAETVYDSFKQLTFMLGKAESREAGERAALAEVSRVPTDEDPRVIAMKARAAAKKATIPSEGTSRD